MKKVLMEMVMKSVFNTWGYALGKSRFGVDDYPTVEQFVDEVHEKILLYGVGGTGINLYYIDDGNHEELPIDEYVTQQQFRDIFRETKDRLIDLGIL